MKRSILKWAKRIFLVLMLIAIVWVINLIWFKPFIIEHFYNRTFVKVMLKDPELAALVDFKLLDWFTKGELTDESDDAQWERFNIYKEELATLRAYNFESLSKDNQLNTKILEWYLNSQVEREPFFYHGYSNDHLNSDALSFPRLMRESHGIKSESDVETYMERLKKFQVKANQLIEIDNLKAEKGILPPTFILDKTILAIERIIGIKPDSVSNVEDHQDDLFYNNLEKKIDKLGTIDNEKRIKYLAESKKIIEESVVPSYQKYLSNLKQLRQQSNTDAGVWKLPNGDKYYRYKLKEYTTTELEPNEIYKIGISEVNRLKSEMKEIINDFDYPDSLSMREVITKIAYDTDRILYATNGSKSLSELIIDNYSNIIAEADTAVEAAFNLKPKSKMIVKPTPEFLGVDATNQYRYIDGQGIFYLNLSGLENNDTISVAGANSLAYHEGIPGHHFQIALQREMKDVPMFRNVLPFTSYTEGWALYAEQLAYEVGLYKDDPAGNLGRLWSELFRAVRLVVDTGIHSQKWSRDRAIQYMLDNLDGNRRGVEREIDRYIVQPGQACAYKVGMMKILDLRDRCKSQLGDNYDIKEFHDLVLKNGPLPLEMLEKFTDDYIATKK